MNQHPLIVNATFKCDDMIMKRMWTTGYKGIQQLASTICYDTPYYQQIPYTGDTRVQALQALYLAGDDRLMKKAILDFYHSKTPEYMTNTRNLGGRMKILPTFSLYWVCMIYDYWMHRKDDAFIKPLLPSVQGILDWYDRQLIGDQEMLGAIKWWSFVDWDKYNGWGISPDPKNGKSSIMSFQYAYTLKLASKLFKAYGDPDCAKNYFELSEEISRNTLRLCLNNEKCLVADSPEQTSFSQYANIWAILSGAVEDKKADDIMYHLLYDKQITQLSDYYKFYLNLALKMVNMGDYYQMQLAKWERLRNLDFQSPGDKSEPVLEDLNGWSRFPNYEFLSSICGITSASPGFKKVLIQPALGNLKEIEASMPHPNGIIHLKFKTLSKERMSAEITLPPKTEGIFIWDKKVYEIHSGLHRIESIVFNNSYL
ncbi:alpha-L-rhamnosidase C-terminal domain-containing protein [Pedobacter gandavensis]|uniref:alpha-L-rhamnosidase-related protein n=1 Tax=Pedobacter gandavensis TaxID=2679963 RepID=UPI00292D544B|nr:alpha-L-rhamnosidase C-terminal domain-containing protein [Pedobacter gandavensis]